jgi:NADH:ubiquinone oxidoreductase subunit 2 (subunit N)
MTNKIHDGGPAFPTQEIRDGNGNGIVEPAHGMSMLRYLAAHAPITLQDAQKYMEEQMEFTYAQLFKTLAAMRVSYAEAMLTALIALESEAA